MHCHAAHTPARMQCLGLQQAIMAYLQAHMLDPRGWLTSKSSESCWVSFSVLARNKMACRCSTVCRLLRTCMKALFPAKYRKEPRQFLVPHKQMAALSQNTRPSSRHGVDSKAKPACDDNFCYVSATPELFLAFGNRRVIKGQLFTGLNVAQGIHGDGQTPITGHDNRLTVGCTAVAHPACEGSLQEAKLFCGLGRSCRVHGTPLDPAAIRAGHIPWMLHQ